MTEIAYLSDGVDVRIHVGKDRTCTRCSNDDLWNQIDFGQVIRMFWNDSIGTGWFVMETMKILESVRGSNA